MSTICVILVVSTGAVNAQTSSIFIGDKTIAEIKASVKILSAQLEELKGQIKDLKAEGKKEVSDLEQEKKKLLRHQGANQFAIVRTDSIINKVQAKNDSLLNVYIRKMSDLESQRNSFALLAVGKDQINNFSLKSRQNPIDVATAYSIIKYADRMNSNGTAASADSARIENNWINRVNVTIKGPAGWHTSFILERNEYVVLPISSPGSYVVQYAYGNNTTCVAKVFDLRNSDLDVKTGRRYAFLSELPAR